MVCPASRSGNYQLQLDCVQSILPDREITHNIEGFDVVTLLTQLTLALCQRVQLKLPAFIPQPGVGVGDPPKFGGQGERRSRFH